jgi:hypothetical protein
MDMSKSGVIKPQKLDTLRPVNPRNFFQWKTVLEGFLKTNSKYVPFLDSAKTWSSLNDNTNRGQTGEDVQTLNCLITTLASYGPESLIHDTINECDSLKYYYQRICELFSLESTGATIFQYHKTRKSFKHDGRKSYQDFYFELRATRYETLLKATSGINYKGKPWNVTEKMTPAIECGIVLDWLEGIDERLPAYVEQKFANELQSVTITDIQVEISKHLDSYLTDIKDKEVAKSFRTQIKLGGEDDSDTSASEEDQAIARYVRGNGFKSKRGGFKQSRNQPKCAICKETDRNPFHPTHKCRFMSQEDKKSVAKAFFTKVTSNKKDLKDGDDSSDDNQ